MQISRLLGVQFKCNYELVWLHIQHCTQLIVCKHQHAMTSHLISNSWRRAWLHCRKTKNQIHRSKINSIIIMKSQVHQTWIKQISHYRAQHQQIMTMLVSWVASINNTNEKSTTSFYPFKRPNANLAFHSVITRICSRWNITISSLQSLFINNRSTTTVCSSLTRIQIRSVQIEAKRVIIESDSDYTQ